MELCNIVQVNQEVMVTPVYKIFDWLLGRVETVCMLSQLENTTRFNPNTFETGKIDLYFQPVYPDNPIKGVI